VTGQATPPGDPAGGTSGGLAGRLGTPADAVLGHAPRLVFEPATEAEAVEAMRACARDRLRVLVVGGGTDLALGHAPAAVDAVLRTGRLSGVVEHAPQDQIVRALAGTTLAALQAHLAPHGQRLALDPPFPARATLGGLVCANGYGPLRASRGSTRDLVIGATLVRADGVLARGGGKVVKNVAGFDLPRLLVGSLGTLGLLTTVNFRLHPLPEARATLRFAGLDAAGVRRVVKAALAAQVEPAALAALRPPGGGPLALGLRFEGFGPGVAGQVERLLAAAAKDGLPGERLDDTSAAAFWAGHDAAREVGPFRARLAAPPAAAEAMAAALEALIRALPGGSAGWYPSLGLGFAGGAPSGAPAIVAALAAARQALGALGGSVVVSAAPDELRAALDPWGAPPAAPVLALMRRLKAQLDPEGRLAPGRMVGGL
jgi:glycolate oxidase FAD binding subunit